MSSHRFQPGNSKFIISLIPLVLQQRSQMSSNNNNHNNHHNNDNYSTDPVSRGPITIENSPRNNIYQGMPLSAATTNPFQ